MFMFNREIDAIKDNGPEPFVTNINRVTMANNYYRNTLWTGANLQMTLMQLNPGEDIGLEVHPDVDQFLYVLSGYGVAMMGATEEDLTYQKTVQCGFGIFVPQGTWHNLVNKGNSPLKMFTIYAPPEHPRGTVHKTKEIAMQEENKE